MRSDVGVHTVERLRACPGNAEHTADDKRWDRRPV